MDAPDREYLIPDGIPLRNVEEALAAHRAFTEDPPREIRRTFFDTFDWRVFLAGAALEELQNGTGPILRWRQAGETAPCEQAAGTGTPGVAAALPPGPVRERVTVVAGIRRLLPVVEVRTDTRTLRLQNEDGKTVVRLRLDRNRFREPSGDRNGLLATRLYLQPLKGYEDELGEAERFVEDRLGLSPGAVPLFLEALTAVGRRPGDYSSKLDYTLDPGERADLAAKQILLGLLDTLEANIPGTRANLDSEFLHDLRVATRRTRSALGQIKGVFPPAVVEDFAARFAWLQQVTGPVRDLDVYLLGFEDYRAALPEPLRPHLAALRDFLEARYEAAQAALASELASDNLEGLLRDWRAFLEAPIPGQSQLPNAMRPVKAVADERIWRMLRRVRREGRVISPDTPVQEMHELRKSCKKLRYLMEFFQSLYPPEDIQGPIKLLKKLLDNLGGFQDLAVQAVHLREIALDMHQDADTLLAMGALVGDLYRRQQEERQGFAELFARFDADDNRALMRTLFHAGRSLEETS